MSTVVIMPGGFHPFHAGHYALYKSALEAFPNAEVYVAATNDQSERPFPFQLKEKLAKLAGVEPGHFIQVKSPFQAKEITQHFNPEQDVLIFVRSEKDRNESPKPGGTKKDGTPAYFQPWTGKDLQPFAKHAYFAYLPTVEFGPGITSATQIRKAWPTLNDKRKLALVMSLYPATQKNSKLAQTVVGMFDQVMGGQVDEDVSRRGFLKGLGVGAAAGAGINAVRNTSPTKKLYTVFGDGKYITQIEATSEKEAEQQVENNPKYKTTQYKVISAHIADPYGAGGTQKWSATKQTKSLRNVSVGDTEHDVYSKAGSPNKKSVNAASNREAWWYNEGVIWMIPGGSGGQMKVWDIDYTKNESVSEGDVVPFRRPQATPLTWQQLPKDVLKLANDWYWAAEENSGLDAVLDPQGYGNGTRNELQYITAQLQQRGWSIDFNDEHDKPGEFNLILKNKNGQSILLSIEDAQDFKGWAQGTNSDLREGQNPLVDLTPNFPNYTKLVGEFVGLQGNKIALRIVSAELKPGTKPTEKIAKAMAANRPITMSPNYVRNRTVVGEEEDPSYEYRPPGASAAQTRNVMNKMNPGQNKFIWKKPNQIGGSFTERELLSQGFKKSQFNSWGGTQAMWDRLLGVKEGRIMFTDPNAKVNVYFNSKNPKYYGKPVLVGKAIPYSKLDLFIDMIVAKYEVKPTEFIWKDARGDNTLAHSINEEDDYLEEK